MEISRRAEVGFAQPRPGGAMGNYPPPVFSSLEDDLGRPQARLETGASSWLSVRFRRLPLEIPYNTASKSGSGLSSARNRCEPTAGLGFDSSACRSIRPKNAMGLNAPGSENAFWRPAECLDGENGRHSGLKNRRLRALRVRVPLRASEITELTDRLGPMTLGYLKGRSAPGSLSRPSHSISP
jgi:hypothetical protein